MLLAARVLYNENVITIKGWVMDVERLKRGTYLTEKYLDFAESMTLWHIPLTMQDWKNALIVL